MPNVEGAIARYPSGCPLPCPHNIGMIDVADGGHHRVHQGENRPARVRTADQPGHAHDRLHDQVDPQAR